MKITLKNYTPHPIVVRTAKGDKMLPTDGIARVNTCGIVVGDLNGIPLYATQVRGAGELPPVVKGTAYIVSAFVKSICPQRADFLVPTKLVRDANGTVVACGGLSI